MAIGKASWVATGKGIVDNRKVIVSDNRKVIMSDNRGKAS